MTRQPDQGVVQPEQRLPGRHGHPLPQRPDRRRVAALLDHHDEPVVLEPGEPRQLCEE
ncbi:hypothetical protein [Dactylosporangium sp. NPDC000521]|uniref:hypothetical protein n=1 Tax=Dactylosporangium sp. NPDC000521 TaxID=3363975 RepID=UPI00367D3BF0